MGTLSERSRRELATSESGIALIYKALDALVEQFELDDAAVVIDEPGLGRQVFRAGRRPLDADDEELLDAAPGPLHRPAARRATASTARSMLSLCVLALRLDVLRYDAWHDPLTGLYDRRSFDRLLEMAIARSTRYGWPFTLVMLDLDDLKTINDERVTRPATRRCAISANASAGSCASVTTRRRIGGDEFAMILPNTEPDLVPALLERVRRADGVETRVPRVLVRRRAVPRRGDRLRRARAARRHAALRSEGGER